MISILFALSILCTLVVVDVLLYILNSVIPMAQPIKLIIKCVVVLLVVAWLLHAFGLWDMGPRYRLR